jgi:hypothetical protein
MLRTVDRWLVTNFRDNLSVPSSRIKQCLTCAETSVTSYQSTLCNITEELRSRVYGGGSLKLRIALIILTSLFVSMGVRGKPRMYLSLDGLLYRPLWTFQLLPPDASAPTDASRTLASAPTDASRTLAAEVGTYERGMRTGNLA